MFFLQKEEELNILPALPPEIPCGKWTSLPLKEGNFLHIEWTKKKLRRVVLECKQDAKYQWNFPSKIKSFRWRSNLSQKGNVMSNGELVSVEAGNKYLLDLFKK